MAAFPNVKFGWNDLSEAHEPVTERSEMERGIPKQRRKSSDARVEVQMTVFFDTSAETTDFEDWFYDDINAGQAWFDWTHPRTGVVLQARVVNGELGPLKYQQPTLQAASRTFKLEYWRASW